MASLLTSFVVTLTLADAAGADPAAGETRLQVPYLSQTRALCGGAAAAMVFRYWGDRRADVQQFASLVDPQGLGIADDVLVDAVRQRHWQAVPLVASLDIVRDRLAAGQPLILLLQDRPGRYHYVVAAGSDPDGVFLHDPTWGPWRRYSNDELMRLWKPSNFWALLILPGETRPEQSVADRLPNVTTPRSACDRLLDDAIDEIAGRGLDSADDLLAGVRRVCPAAAAPLAELAAVRFAQKRWMEAEHLASDAIEKDPSLQYAWDVLGSTRFVQNDPYGALRAWNRIGKPQLDSVLVDGLSRTRYVLVAGALGLTPNTMLTESGFRLAERRLHQLPDRAAARIAYRPEEDGFATLDVVVVERPRWVRAPAQWLNEAGRAAVQREVRLALPGWTGQGEVWTASWRWWNERPKLSLTFAAPRAGFLRGVSRVEASWEIQTYQPGAGSLTIRETRLHGGVATTDWLTPHLRYEIAAGVDSWNGSERTASIGGRVERRLFEDRLALAAGGHSSMTLSSAPDFGWGGLTASFRSSRDPRGFVQLVNGGIEAATKHAPLALWPGAGDGHGRTPLLRAHALLRGGVIAGPVFGRRVPYLNVESQRWLERPALVRLGLAAFVDIAKAARVFTSTTDKAHADVGIGLRIQLPGDDGVLRADFARSVRDRQRAFTVGWQLP